MSNKHNPIQAIIFDMYNTLIIQSGGYEKTSEYISKTFNIPINKYKEARRSTYQDALIGNYQSPIERVNAILYSLNQADLMDKAKDLVNAELSHHKENIIVFPEVIEVLSKISARRIKLGLISNATPEWREVFLSLPLSKLFDEIVFSYKVRVTKPDPAIYWHTLSQLNCLPENTIFVGDGADNELEGAHKIGMQTVWISRSENKPKERFNNGIVDYKVRTLEEILVFID